MPPNNSTRSSTITKILNTAKHVTTPLEKKPLRLTLFVLHLYFIFFDLAKTVSYNTYMSSITIRLVICKLVIIENFPQIRYFQVLLYKVPWQDINTWNLYLKVWRCNFSKLDTCCTFQIVSRLQGHVKTILRIDGIVEVTRLHCIPSTHQTSWLHLTTTCQCLDHFFYERETLLEWNNVEENCRNCGLISYIA